MTERRVNKMAALLAGQHIGMDRGKIPAARNLGAEFSGQRRALRQRCQIAQFVGIRGNVV